MPNPLDDRLLFADTLRQLMEQAGLSGVELARRLGTHPTSVSRWRSGEDRPRPEIVSRLADILGIDRLLLLRSAGYLQPDPSGPPAPTLDPRLSTLLAQIEAGWLAMDSEAERDLAERGARALFAVQPVGRGPANGRRDGAGKRHAGVLHQSEQRAEHPQTEEGNDTLTVRSRRAGRVIGNALAFILGPFTFERPLTTATRQI